MSTQPEEQQNPPQNPPENPPNPPADPPQNPPQNPPANPPERTAQVAQDATRQLLDARSLQDLRTEIQALPERIVNGIREATQPPRSASTNPASTSGNGGTPTGGAGNAPGQRKSFADWWFNS